jgi:hypothetical protein
MLIVGRAKVEFVFPKGSISIPSIQCSARVAPEHAADFGEELMRIIRRAICCAIAAISIAACGPFHRGSQPDAVVVFHNQSTDQADVYAIGSGGDPTRIGTVFGNRTETLRVPATVTGGANRVNVIARMFPNGRVVASGPFTLGPGESMDLTLTGDEKMISALPSRAQ